MTVASGTASAVPYSCDQEGQIKRFYCANVVGLSAGATLAFHQQAALDAPSVSGTAYQNGDSLVLDCWATSPVIEDPPGDSYWFSVFDPNQPKVEGYVSDVNLTTGNQSDWLDVVGECPGNEPEPSKQGTFQCDYHGGQDIATCAQVASVSDLSYIHLLDQPDSTAKHLTNYNTYNTGNNLALACWTTGDLVDGDKYWFKVFNPIDDTLTGYINDYYLATGTVADWQQAVPTKCATTGPPPAQVTQLDTGRDPHDAQQYCPEENEEPLILPINLRVRGVKVTGDNEIETTDEGVHPIGTVENCLARQSLSPTQGVVFSRTHVVLADNPDWAFTSRVVGLTTSVSARGQFRQGSLTTVYPPHQVGCYPQACQSETYFLTRAYGPTATGRTGFVQRLADYTFESRPSPNPICNGQYQFTTLRVVSDPGGDNFETDRVISKDLATYEQAGWFPKPGTLNFQGETFAWRSQKTYDGTMWHDEGRDRVTLRTPGSRVEVKFSIDDGKSVTTRHVDVLNPDGTAIEIKTFGSDRSLSSKLQTQINKDAALLASPSSGVHHVIWMFLPNPTNPSNIGPSASLRAALVKAGIDVKPGNAGRLCS
jgi:hypothetical protein